MECDVLIVAADGGGCREEIWRSFNDERVVRGYFCQPYLGRQRRRAEDGCNHCRFVADLRAPTPPVAAEVVGP